MFWNNKEFFPRKSYAENTRITAFGALSICEQNAQLEGPSWYDGHTGDTWDASPNKAELAGGRFIDACDDSASVLLTADVGLDDDSIFIPLLNEDGSAPSILTLMGRIHPGFRSTVNEKTCVFADSGECIDILAEHNDSTIRDITFSPDEYGYYLDDLVASGENKCLFSPFKIMVDVECCPDRVGHKGTTDPTNLNYLAKIPAANCTGWVNDPACDCDDDNEHSCQRKDDGPDLPGLSCAQAVIGYFVDSGVECYSKCVTSSEQFNDLQKSGYFALNTEDFMYLMDPTGGFPLDAATPVSIGQYQNTSDNGETGCLHTCDIYEGIYGYLTVSYDYTPMSRSLLNLYTYDGRLFHVPDIDPEVCVEYMDVFDFGGSLYRFSNNVPGQNAVHEANCCQPDGAIGVTDIFDKKGCSCEWTQCEDVEKAIPITSKSPVWTGFPNWGFYNEYTLYGGIEEGYRRYSMLMGARIASPKGRHFTLLR